MDRKLLHAIGRRVPVLVFVYLNRMGLSNMLGANGLLGNEVNMDQFIMGFNQSSPLFSIIDAGSGKEAADSKIRGTASDCDM